MQAGPPRGLEPDGPALRRPGSRRQQLKRDHPEKRPRRDSPKDLLGQTQYAHGPRGRLDTGSPRTEDGGIIIRQEGLFPAGKPSGPWTRPLPVPPRQHAVSGGYSPRQYMVNINQGPPTDRETPIVQITLELLVDAPFFQTEQAEEAEELARRTGGRVYSWKTAGKHNWLEAGYSRVDVIGLAVLPGVLPQTVTMPNDSIATD